MENRQCEPMCAVFLHVVTSTVLSAVLHVSSYVRCSSISFHAALTQYSGSRLPTDQSV